MLKLILWSLFLLSSSLIFFVCLTCVARLRKKLSTLSQSLRACLKLFLCLLIFFSFSFSHSSPGLDTGSTRGAGEPRHCGGAETLWGPGAETLWPRHCSARGPLRAAQWAPQAAPLLRCLLQNMICRQMFFFCVCCVCLLFPLRPLLLQPILSSV